MITLLLATQLYGGCFFFFLAKVVFHNPIRVALAHIGDLAGEVDGKAELLGEDFQADSFTQLYPFPLPAPAHASLASFIAVLGAL